MNPSSPIVTVGAKYDDKVVVADGLSGSERVVVNGMQRARPGAEVAPEETQLAAIEGELSSVEEGSQSPIDDPAQIPSPEVPEDVQAAAPETEQTP